MQLVLVSLFFLSVILVQHYLHFKQTKDLLDRLMARTFEDFKRFDTKPEENNFGDEDENLLNIEEAKDDMSPGV